MKKYISVVALICVEKSYENSEMLEELFETYFLKNEWILNKY